MSLALRLTLSFAGLILALGLAVAIGVRALTGDLTSAVGEAAASVGRSVVTVLRSKHSEGAADPAAALPSSTINSETFETETIDLRGSEPVKAQREIRMVVNGRELTPEEITARLRESANGPQIELRGGEPGAPPMLWVRSVDREQSIALPRAGVDAALATFQQRLWIGLLLLLLLAILVASWLARRLALPLARLADAADGVGRGALGAQVIEQGPPEVRRSLVAFNRMSSELQRLDRETTRLRADRELAELGEIGRGLAHSLRNPLHALGLSLDALASHAPEAPAAQALANAGREQLSRIDQALRGFLALAAGSGALAEDVSLAAVIDDVLLEASQRAGGRVQLSRSGDDITVRGVAAELRILVHTLVVNALEASPEGGRVQIQIHPRAAGGAQIAVLDQGPGIAPAIRQRLFAPHVSSKPTGAGMGLYLAQRLAQQRYAGGIELEGTGAGGTRATLSLADRVSAHGS